MTFRLTPHAQTELSRRAIPPDVLKAVLDTPEQVLPERRERKAYQSRHEIGGIMFLVRAIVDDRVDPAIVVTVYRTSKIAKYWR
jgi:hypothetical protein